MYFRVYIFLTQFLLPLFLVQPRNKQPHVSSKAWQRLQIQNLHLVLPSLCTLKLTQLFFLWELILKRSSGNIVSSLTQL